MKSHAAGCYLALCATIAACGSSTQGAPAPSPADGAVDGGSPSADAGAGTDAAAAGDSAPVPTGADAAMDAFSPIGWRRIGGMPALYNKVVFCNERFLMVSDAGAVRTSTDGQDWTSAATGGTIDLADIACGPGGRYVAIGAIGPTGTIRTSADGMLWTGAMTPVSLAQTLPRGIVYANDKFMVVGDRGLLLTSPDGVTWTSHADPTPTGKARRTVTAGKGTFVAAAGAEIETSPDGATWTSRKTLAQVVNRLAFLNERFVAVGDANSFATSTDGSEWIEHPFPSYNPARTMALTRLQDVAFGSGQWVVVGLDAAVVSSSTAFIWTGVHPSLLPGVESLHGVAYGNGRFVAAGSLGVILVNP